MRIAVIGRGKVGSAIGQGWAGVGHEVVYGSREPAGPDEARIEDVAARAEVVALATPWGAVPAVVAAAGGLKGKTVIDCTNPLAMTHGRLGLASVLEGSAAQALAALAPEAFVVKALNQTGAETMADARRFAPASMMFAAGDDAGRKALVLGLVADLGFEALDAGPLANAALLEALAMLWIDQATARGQDRAFAFARLRA